MAKTTKLLSDYDRALIAILTCVLCIVIAYLLFDGREATVSMPPVGQICPDAKVRVRHAGNLDWRNEEECRVVYLRDTVYTPPGQRARVEFENRQTLEMEPDSMVQFDWIDPDGVEINFFFGQGHGSAGLAVRGRGALVDGKTLAAAKEVLRTGLPFEYGERLEYELRLRQLPVGTAVSEVHQGAEYNGHQSIHFSGSLRSNWLTSRVYKVDDGGEALIDRQTDKRFLVPLYSRFVREETKHQMISEARFDPKLRQVMQVQLVTERQPAGMPKPVAIGLKGPTMDPLSTAYQVRTLDYELHKSQQFSVYVNQQFYDVELTPEAVEMVRTRVGPFNCWKVRVQVRRDGALVPRGGGTLWISKDAKRYPVRFEGMTPKGLASGILISIRDQD